jgi:hypothetical protein
MQVFCHLLPIVAILVICPGLHYLVASILVIN